MEFIATNHHILEKIFTFCKTTTLLECRLVCKLWGDEATRILKKRGHPIEFKSAEDIDQFLQVVRPITQMLTNFMIDLPSYQFQVIETILEVPTSIIDLLECYKDDLSDLKLWYQPQAQEGVLQIDGKIVSGKTITLTSLRSLQLLSNYVHHSASPTQNNQNLNHRMPQFFSHLVLPNLRSLAIQHLYETECSSTVINLMKGAQHTLSCLKIPAKPFPIVAQASSICMSGLRELDLLGIFHGFSCATNETVDSIIKSCPNLEKLGIEFSFRTSLGKIRELLKTLAASLIEFKCTIQDRNLLARQIVRVDFTFPDMERLKSLQMRWSNPGLVYHLHGAPALEELLLDTVWTRKIQGNIFPNGAPFTDIQYQQLRCLKLTEVVSAVQVQVFSQYFPSLEMLGCSFESNEALRTVYEKMKGLRWLIIERKSNVTEAGGICGVEEDALEEVVSSKGSNIIPSLCSPSRKLQYVGNLQDLETLELCQMNVTWCSLAFGVADLPKLKNLVIHSKAFKMTEESALKHASWIGELTSKLTKLRRLTLWIRHNSERLLPQEVQIIKQKMPELNELNIVNHSLCGI